MLVLLFLTVSAVLVPANIARGTEYLTPLIAFGNQTFGTNLGPGPFKEADVYYDYPTVATVNGEWGANVFNGNDDNKVFDKILPVGSQWQVYGYTLRTDGWYYYVGGDMWLQADQVKVPASDSYDALLNVEAFLGGRGTKDDYAVAFISDEYGLHYKAARYVYDTLSGGPIFQITHIYNVYADGQVYNMGTTTSRFFMDQDQ